MPLVFHLPPAKINAAINNNPAENLAKDGDLEFGLTIPNYNGKSIVGVDANDVLVPTIVNTQGAFAVAGVTYNAHARVTAVPTHNISWPMHLPPNPQATGGRWTSVTRISGRTLVERIGPLIAASRREVGKPLRADVDFVNRKDLVKAKNQYRVVIVPQPSAREFMDHIEFHECQHVVDHMWLADRIIGWWDAWLTDLMTKNIEIMSKTGLSGLSVGSGFGYAVNMQRIVTYWCRAAAQSGDLYHDTAQGAHPVLNVQSITDDEITLTVHPREIIREKPSFVNCIPHQSMTFMTANLNGNEPRLTAGAAPANVFLNRLVEIDATHRRRP